MRSASASRCPTPPPRSGTGTGTGRGKAHKAKLDDLVSRDINKNKMVRYENLDPTKLGNLFGQTQNTISTLNDKYDPKKNPKWDGDTISEAMSYTKDGHYMLIDDGVSEVNELLICGNIYGFNMLN